MNNWTGEILAKVPSLSAVVTGKRDLASTATLTVPAEVAGIPAVVIARQHLDQSDQKGTTWTVGADLAEALIAAIANAVEGEPNDLLEILAQAIRKTENNN